MISLTDEPASDAVRREWLRRVEAEYRSAALTGHLTLWLIQLGAPPDLIESGLSIVSDEMAHSELSAEVLAAAGSRQAPRLERSTLELRRTTEPLEHDALRCALDSFCLGETVAVRLFRRLRAGCTVPVARKALDRILLDEVSHREFGWTLLEWLLKRPDEHALREVITRELPGMLQRIRASYGAATARAGAGVPGSGVPFPAADVAWGLMQPTEYAAAVAETFERDYGPRFAALGIHISTP